MVLVSRLLIVLIIGLCYLTIWKSLRSSLMYMLINQDSVTQSYHITKIEFRSHSIQYELSESLIRRKIYVKAPFGLYFLISIFALILMRLKPINGAYVLGFQLVFGLIAIIMFNIGLSAGNILLISSDFLTRYFNPICTLSIPLFSYIKTKNLPSNP